MLWLSINSLGDRSCVADELRTAHMGNYIDLVDLLLYGDKFDYAHGPTALDMTAFLGGYP